MREIVRCEVMLRPSRVLLALNIAAYIVTSAVVVLLLPSWWGAALVMLLGAYAFVVCRRQFSPASLTRVQGVRYDGGWSLMRAGQWSPATLRSPLFCHRHLLVLRLKPVGACVPIEVAISGDSCAVDEFRRLRVLSKHLTAQQLWALSR